MSYYRNIDKKFKKKWLKALRTPLDEGGYYQTESALYSSTDLPAGRNHTLPHRVDAFCCLGVACNLLVESGDLSWEDEYYEETGYADGHLRKITLGQDSPDSLEELGMPPGAILDKIGMTPKAAAYVADMNDEGIPFSAIADWIESHL